jgi:hypothetical protein
MMVNFKLSNCDSCYDGSRCNNDVVSGYFMGQCVPDDCLYAQKNYIEWNGHQYINTTPHEIMFRDEATGDEFTVPKCGALINAKPVEVPAEGTNNIELVRTIWETDETSLVELEVIEHLLPGAIVIGSIIAAQAYPGRVLAMTPCQGFERVAPAEKRMNPRKFTTFKCL